MKHLMLALLAAMAIDLPKLPLLLEQALAKLPGHRLLDPSIDLSGGYTVEELKDFGYWPPWVVEDMDRDGRPDVVAVVVKPGDSPEIGVIAVHARTPGLVHWIAPLGARMINGVARGPARDTVTPLYCVECDANSWFRWSRREYEAELYAVGERVAIATYEKDHELGLFGKATRDSRFLFRVTPCTEATVRRVAGTGQQRWYFVETGGRQSVRGWIPASFAAESECIG